ncbi:hypothetical protein [Chondromyces crocatus]|uniref:Uncharacterized protein n=1 Tax=Chondromyces crocatus TaxID=52 RepID=A0A0K1EAU0_CHOCO|nr:hypothetical protein [Chondromyces crocatus]AKT37985.1 uncharacterized protein CMC5_021260 [Chondromyces crocatus]
MRRTLFAAGVGFGLAGIGGLAAHDAQEALAQVPPTTAQPASPSTPAAAQPASSVLAVSGCKLKGTQAGRKGQQLFDAAMGGRAIATLTGALVPMTLSEIPVDPAQARARLSTSAGSPSLRLDAYVPVSEVTVFTMRDLSVVPSHVWATSGHKVKIVSASADALRAELTIGGTENQKVPVSGSCDAFSLQPGKATPMEVPGNARGYMTKRSTLDLYDRANGSVVFSLKMIEGSGQLFWSTESKAGFVHVQSRSDISVDGWARWGDLEALKKGELRDQYVPPTTALAGAKLALENSPPVVKATKEIPVRARRDEKEKPIGVIEAGAELYMMETIAGWTNVLPVSLGMTPPEDGGFWIPSSEAPK